VCHSRGEKIAHIIEHGKAFTFQTGNEHAVVKMANGERVIVSGGPGGSQLSSDVTRVFGHSDLYLLPWTGLSADDFGMFDALGKKSSWLLEHGQLIRLRAN
jgi:hypothetical protein